MIKILLETNRLILREIIPQDVNGMYELDANPEVHKYLGNKPIKNKNEAKKNIDFIRQQYIDNGIGRWAVIEKESNSFLGWAGLKLMKEEVNHHVNYYDLGYRFIKKYWGMGYATEAAKASLAYGFTELNLQEIFAIADCENTGSNIILTKIGLKQTETFFLKGLKHHWYTLSKEDGLAIISKKD